MPPLVRRLARERIVAPLLFILLACLLLSTEALWNWDKIYYDWLQKFSLRTAPDDIVIVAIDDQSLAASEKLGDWPWSRAVHADLLDKLIEAKSVLFDIAFFPASQNDVSGDTRLVESVGNHGRVVLPVLVESLSEDGQLLELLPFPGLPEKANALGHVDRELDKDAVVRTGFLKAGLGDPHWPSVALAMLQVAGESPSGELLGSRRPISSNASSYTWVRDYHIWIPFAGPPGHFTYVSYLDVISGKFQPGDFRDKYVLVGATAQGMRDSFLTPVSGRNSPMPGVELIANELDALRRGLIVTPLSLPWSMLLTILLIAMPAVIYPRFRNRWSLGVWPLMMLSSLFISMLLMAFRIWFPPLTAFVMVALSYVAWSFIRVIRTVTFLDRELQRLGQVQDVFSTKKKPRISDLLSFAKHFFPIEGGIVLDQNGHAKQSWGDPPTLDQIETRGNDWRINPPSLWKTLPRGNENWSLGINWGHTLPPDESATNLIEAVAKRLSDEQVEKAKTPVGLLQSRITNVRSATERMQFLYRFVEDTVEQMADGVIVIDDVGTVIVANPVAAASLSYESAAELRGTTLPDALGALEFESEEAFEEGLRQVYVDKLPVQISAQTESGQDVLAQLVPFEFEGGVGTGMLINLVDVSILKERERQRRQLITFLSHDLRSPLASILAITTLAKMKEGTVAGDDLESIERNANNTLRLADDFLELARAEYIEPTSFEPVDIIPIAESALASTAGHAKGKNTTIVKDLCESAIINGDAGLIDRVLTNLLSNAIKYSPESSHIELGVVSTDGKVHCWVRDDGLGIAAEELPKIFDSFHRVRGQKHNEKGSGVGLSFVKTVVERHGGTINVESEEEKGSCFHIYFPEVKS